ncbi:MAG: hypothetical protein QOE90_3709 [Thermoplasmata archaeon]|nr:hypothetical protein [Thermoplasmata archaeon]
MLRIWTIGHSNRTPEAFLDLLVQNGIQRVVDVRTLPRSRHNAWTSVDALPGILAARGISHAHLPTLGGLRKPRPESPNGAWRNESFRGYADHMRTPEFEEGLATLLRGAAREPTAIMCAEAVPWRCHRSLIADALLARGVEVLDIIDGPAKPHRMTPFARVVEGRVTYPPAGGEQTRLL